MSNGTIFPTHDPRQRTITISFLIWVLAATILGAALRLYRVEEPGMWINELYTIRDCGQLDEINRSKLLGYLPTAAWLSLNGVKLDELLDPDCPPDSLDACERTAQWQGMGVSPAAARMASCLIGILSIPLLGLAACKVIGRQPAVFLMLLLTVATWHIQWSQAARYYTQEYLFYNLALLLYFVATRDQKRLVFVGAMVCMILGFLSQPPALLVASVFAVEWLAAIVLRQPVRLGWFGWIAAVVSLGLCGLILKLDVGEHQETWAQLAETYQSPMKLGPGVVYMVGAPTALFALMSGVWFAQRGDRAGRYMLIAAIVPILAFMAIATQAQVGLRYLFMISFAWIVLAAMGASYFYDVMRERAGIILALAPIAVCIGVSVQMDFTYYTDGHGLRPRWNDALAYVARHAKDTDAIATERQLAEYYLQRPIRFDIEQTTKPDRKAENAARIQAGGQPTWIIIPGELSVRGSVGDWVGSWAELKAYFDLHVQEPYSSLHVYYYDPQAARPAQ